MVDDETSNSSSNTHGAADPHTQITWMSFLGLEELWLKLLHSVELQGKNSSPIFNFEIWCWFEYFSIWRGVRLDML